MTEAEWLSSNDPEAMLQFVGRYTSRRKELLFAVVCCRRLAHLLDDDTRKRLARIESAADQPLSIPDHAELINDAMAHADGLSYLMGTPIGSARWLAANAVWEAAEGKAIGVVDQVSDAVAVAKLDPDTFDILTPQPPIRGDPSELVVQADLLRHVVGNPYRQVEVSDGWRTDLVVSLVRRMYESRDFSEMPVLADALQEAGCEDTGLLRHCRNEGSHVRGCWVVDLLLDKL